MKNSNNNSAIKSLRSNNKKSSNNSDNIAHVRQRVPRGYWNNKENQTKFVECLGKQLDITHWEDWYKVTQQTLHSVSGGSSLLSVFRGSPSALLRSVYPQYQWKTWKFG